MNTACIAPARRPSVPVQRTAHSQEIPRDAVLLQDTCVPALWDRPGKWISSNGSERVYDLGDGITREDDTSSGVKHLDGIVYHGLPAVADKADGQIRLQIDVDATHDLLAADAKKGASSVPPPPFQYVVGCEFPSQPVRSRRE